MKWAVCLYLIFISFDCQAQQLHYQNTIKLDFKCPGEKVLDKFLNFGDLFFGEHHGTNEIPRFIECLVDRALVRSSEKIIVSLEMPSSAREPVSKFWKNDEINEDGRSSQAMFQLVHYLVDKENQALLNIHFQYHTRFYENTKEVTNFYDNRAQIIGSELANLSLRGQVIALAGNAHSLKFLPTGVPKTTFKSEGMFVGPEYTHIAIDAESGGQVWHCNVDNECGLENYQPFEHGARESGTLMPYLDAGHDYIYYLEQKKFTASKPMGME